MEKEQVKLIFEKI